MRDKRAGIVLVLLVLAMGSVSLVFRDAIRDEALYLQDAAIMAQRLADGHWFGNEPVGLHGFLFKLPAALIFVVTGPSVTAATLVTILYAMLAVWLCYLLFLRVTGSNRWAVAGVLVLIGSYHFLDTLPTFLREIPALLSVLILLHGIVNRKSRWWTLLGLTLILDSKELLYFMILPGLWFYTFRSHFREGKRQILLQSLIFLLPFLVTVGLMFFTGIVPLNPRIPYIMGLHQQGFLRAMQWKFAFTSLPLAIQPAAWLSPTGGGGPIIGWFWSLLVYVFGPKGLSLVSIPKFIVIPAIAMGLRVWKRWHESPTPQFAALPFIALPPLLLVVITRSSGRHLLPIAPILILLFILFVRDGIQDHRFYRSVLLAISAAVTLEMVFPHPKLWLNLGLQSLVLAALWLHYFLRRRTDAPRAIIALLPIALCVFATSSSAIGASLLLPGQIGRALAWGRLSEFPAIVTHLPGQSPVWINANPLVASFFTHQDYFPPNISRQYFQNFFQIPKSAKIYRSRPQLVHYYQWDDIDDFIYRLRRDHIDSVIMVSSTTKNKKFRFPLQDLLPLLEIHPEFHLQTTFSLKNKNIHIFRLFNH